LGENSISREPCHLIDIVPTFMELSGKRAEYPSNVPELDGISLQPTFRGEQLERGRPLFFQYGSWQVIRENMWKLVQHKSEAWELYDLSKDRTETINLAKDFPERVLRMKNHWENWAKELGVHVKEKKKFLRK